MKFRSLALACLILVGSQVANAQDADSEVPMPAKTAAPKAASTPSAQAPVAPPPAAAASAQAPAAPSASAPASTSPSQPAVPPAQKTSPATAAKAPSGAQPQAAQQPSQLPPPASPPSAADVVSAQQLLNELQNADDPYTTTLLQTRDPFNPPPIVAEAAVEKTPLELVPLEQIKISGIVTGLNQHKAILVTPDGKTHIVGERTKIGTRKGIVKKITGNTIVVRERFANVFGKEENIDTEIKIIEKDKKR